MTKYWLKNVIVKADECLDINSNKRTLIKQVSIKLEDLASAFFILGAGAGLAFVSFLTETVTSYYFLRNTVSSSVV